MKCSFLQLKQIKQSSSTIENLSSYNCSTAFGLKTPLYFNKNEVLNSYEKLSFNYILYRWLFCVKLLFMHLLTTLIDNYNCD